MAGTVELDLYVASLQVRGLEPIASAVGFREEELARLSDLLGRPSLEKVALTEGEAAEAARLLERLAPSVPLDRWPDVPAIFARAHDALQALTGPATGRASEDEHAAQIAGSAPPSAVPAATVSFAAARQAAGDRLQFILDDPNEGADRERLLRFMGLTNPSHVRSAEEDRELLALLADLRDHPPPSTTAEERGAFETAHRALETCLAGTAPPSAVPAVPTTPTDRTDHSPSIDWTDRVFVVIGAGPMGRGIAYNFLLQFPGAKVRLCEFKSEILHEAQVEIEGIIADGIRRGKLTAEEADRARANITYWDGKGDPAENGRVIREAVQGATVIQEAIVEKIEPKLALFTILGEAAPDDALIFTNTSSYTVSELEAVMGGKALTAHHYFNPAYKMKLVERARGQNPLSAGQEALLRRYERQLGKVILEAPDTSGFYVNRFFIPLLNVGVALFDQIRSEVEKLKSTAGSESPLQQVTDLDLMVLVDTTTRQALGSPQGPFELLDMTKPHITHHASNVMVERLGGFYAPGGRLNDLIRREKEKGLFGYPILDARKPVEPESLKRLQTALGADRIAAFQKQIQERTWAVLARVMDNLISERIAAGVSPEQAVRDIQIASTVGVGYRAGAIAVMNGVGIERVRTLAGTVEGEGLKPVAFLDSAPLVDGKIPIRLVNLEVVDGVARIRIENPGKRNVLNPEMVAQLTAAFDRAEQDPSVTMIVFEGLGGDLAGADIKFFTDNLKRGVEGLQTIMGFVAAGLNLYSRIEQSKKRTVAVLDGGTYGGGFELALATNEIIVTPQAKLALPETGLGIIPGLRGADRLALRIGEGLAFYFMATGNTSDRTISGQEAHDVGIADYLVERSDLDARLADMAGKPYRGERPRQLPEGHPLKSISELFSSEHFRQALIDGVEDPTAGDKKLSDHPEHYALYKAALDIARQRPRAALELANYLLGIDNDAEDYLAVTRIFLTPMALQGLSTMGRGIKVTNRTPDDWSKLLLERFDHMVRVDSTEGPVLNLRVKDPLDFAEQLDAFLVVLVDRVNARDTDGQVNDLAEIHVRYRVKGNEELRDAVVMRTGPGAHFAVGVQEVLKGPSGLPQSGAPSAATPATSTPVPSTPPAPRSARPANDNIPPLNVKRGWGGVKASPRVSRNPSPPPLILKGGTPAVAKLIYVRALHRAKELKLEKVFRMLVDQSPEAVLTFVRNRAVGRRALDESLSRAGLPPRETMKALLGNSRSVADAVALEYVLFLSRATDPSFSWLAARFNRPGSPLAQGLWGAPASPPSLLRSVITK